jgi:hypothetical protein
VARTFNGTSDLIRTSTGALSGTNGANVTAVIVVRLLTDVTRDRAFIRFYDSTNVLSWGFRQQEAAPAGSLNFATNGGGSVSTWTMAVADGWMCIVASKTSGTTAARQSKFVYSTNTWTHADAGNTIADATITPGSGGTIRFGEEAGTRFLNGDIAAAAIFPYIMTDAQREILPYDLSSWLSMGPSGMWVFDQSDVAVPIMDMSGGGANQTSITGTTFGSTAVPLLGYGHDVIIVSHVPSATNATATPTVVAGSTTIGGAPKVGSIVTVGANVLTLNESSFETDVAPWTAGGNTTITRDTTRALTGAASMRLRSTAAGYVGASINNLPAVIAGKTYRMTARFYTTVAATTSQMSIDWYTSGLSYISTAGTGDLSITASAWTKLDLIGVAPPGAEYADLNFNPAATGATQDFYADGVEFALGSGSPIVATVLIPAPTLSGGYRSASPATVKGLVSIPGAVLHDDFSNYTAGTWLTSSTNGPWTVQSSGYQTVEAGTTAGISYVRQRADPVGDGAGTFSSLVTSSSLTAPASIITEYITDAQLRTVPNRWEVAWTFFNFTNTNSFYYMLLCPDGYWELGKEWFNGTSQQQDFLASGTAGSAWPVGDWMRVEIGQDLRGSALTITVKAADLTRGDTMTTLATVTDDGTRPSGAAYTTGGVGLYNEDADTRFRYVHATARAPIVTGGATATPGVVAGTTSIPTPATLVKPAVVAGTTLIGAPVVQAGSKAAPAVVAGSTLIGAPVVAGAATATPTVVAGSATIGAAVTTGSTAVPAVVAGVTTIGAATVQAGATAVPPAVAGTTTIGGVAAANSTATPTVVAGTATVGAPTVTTVSTPAPPAVAGTVSIPTPTVSASSTALPTAVAGVAAVAAPTLQTGSKPVPAVVAGSTLIGAPAVSTGAKALPAVVAGATTIGSAVTAGGTATPTVVAGTVTFGWPGMLHVAAGTTTTIAGLDPSTQYTVTVRAVDTGGNRSAWSTPYTFTTATSFTGPTTTVVAGSTTIGAPTVQAGSALTPTVVAGSTTVGATVTTGSKALPTVVAGSATIGSPVVAGSATATPTVVAGSTTIGGVAAASSKATPTVVAGTTSISATVTTGSTAVPIVVAGVATVPAPTVTGSATATPTVVAGSTTIAATATTASGSTATPTVVASTTVIGATVTTGSTALPAVVSSTTAIGATVTTGSTAVPAVVQAGPAVIGGAASTGNAPSTVAGTTTIGAPAISTGSKALPAVVAGSTTIGGAPQAGAVAVPAVVAGTVSVPAPAVTTGSKAAPAAVTASVMIGATVSTGSKVVTAAVTGTVTIGTPAFASGVTVVAVTVTSTVVIGGTATTTASTVVAATTVTAYTVIGVPTIPSPIHYADIAGSLTTVSTAEAGPTGLALADSGPLSTAGLISSAGTAATGEGSVLAVTGTSG